MLTAVFQDKTKGPAAYDRQIIDSCETGDLIIAYTDGVVETTDQKGEKWGVQGL